LWSPNGKLFAPGVDSSLFAIRDRLSAGKLEAAPNSGSTLPWREKRKPAITHAAIKDLRLTDKCLYRIAEEKSMSCSVNGHRFCR